MENEEYLNQISAQARPVKPPRKSIFLSKYFLLGVGAVVAFILIAIVGAALGGGGDGVKNTSFALKLHLDATSSVIQAYQPKVKSSTLRSSSASLYSILSDTNRSLTSFVEENYDFKANEVSENLTTAANTAKEALEQDLFEAKINGNLDRVYAHKMAYEISLIATEEAKLIKLTKNDILKESLTKSYNSLDTLYSQFSDFSETK